VRISFTKTLYECKRLFDHEHIFFKVFSLLPNGEKEVGDTAACLELLQNKHCYVEQGLPV
jgi:hypothetical protein